MRVSKRSGASFYHNFAFANGDRSLHAVHRNAFRPNSISYSSILSPKVFQKPLRVMFESKCVVIKHGLFDAWTNL